MKNLGEQRPTAYNISHTRTIISRGMEHGPQASESANP